MPSALLKACRCGALSPSLPCPACAKQQDRTRETRTQRGYTARWYRFKTRVLNTLMRLGIAPVCGAILPGGPVTGDSVCKGRGQLSATSINGDALHLDHEPPLRAEERQDERAVCDSRRVQLLCRSCHSAKTLREQRA